MIGNIARRSYSTAAQGGKQDYVQKMFIDRLKAYAQQKAANAKKVVEIPEARRKKIAEDIEKIKKANNMEHVKFTVPTKVQG
eukprot:Nk52_evm18s2657 gene=Nk52_evmTU18s2657